VAVGQSGDYQAVEVRGVVLNAATNQPLPRALVQVAGRSVLTGHDGRFDFPQVAGGTVMIAARKPGFFGDQDFNPAAMKMVAAADAGNVEVVLHPEALLTGTVRGPDGQPLSGVFVQALRHRDENSGSQWMGANQANTNEDGEFRLAVQAGEYLVETQYSAARAGRREAVLPLIAGAGAGGGGAVPFHVAAGEESRLDLRPQMRESHAVKIHIDDASGASAGDEGRVMPMRLQARMSNGLLFQVMSRQGDTPGEIVATVPRGTYTLIAERTSQDGSSYGETRVTVSDRDVQGVTLHISRVLPLAVEVAADPALTSDNKPPPVEQLGLTFVRTDAAPGVMNQMIFLSSRGGVSSQGGNGGVTLLPGTYRLRAQAQMPWYVESANLGGTDLMSQELTVEAGSSMGPLRLVVSNQAGTVHGTVKLSGNPAQSWVYLVPSGAGLGAVSIARSGPDGVLDRGFVPPGSYRVLASEEQLFLRLSDPAVQAKYSTYIQTVTVAAGETANVELEAIPAAELKP
jgi:hypothetical protein